MNDDETPDQRNKRLERERLQEQQKWEQGAANLGDNLPPLWRRMFLSSIDTGFTEEQAFKIILTYIHGLAGGRLTP